MRFRALSASEMYEEGKFGGEGEDRGDFGWNWVERGAAARGRRFFEPFLPFRDFFQSVG